MKDVLQILQVLEDHAQRDLAVLTKRRFALLNEKAKLVEVFTAYQDHAQNVSEQTVLEKWRQAQRTRIQFIEEQLVEVDLKIDKSKSQFKIAFAKHGSAQRAFARQEQEQQLQKDEADTEAQMELFRLLKPK